MLKLCTEEDKKSVLLFSKKSPLGVKISSNILSYGLDGKLFTLWAQYDDEIGEISSLVSSFCGASVVLTSQNTDFEELSLFVFSSGFLSVNTDAGNIDRFKEFHDIDNLTVTEKTIFVYEGEGAVSNETTQFCDMRSLYRLVCENIPDSFSSDEESYLNFLSDITYRKNRSLGRIEAITDTDNVIACCVTSAEDDERALISCVATHSDKRGLGLGKKVVCTMAEKLMLIKKRPYVIALNKSAENFYKKIGFREVGKVGFING